MAKSRAQQAAIAVAMKKAGKKPRMQEGGQKTKNLPEVTIQANRPKRNKATKLIDNLLRKTYPFNVPYDVTVNAMRKVDNAVESVGRGYNKLKKKVKEHLGVHQTGGTTNKKRSAISKAKTQYGTNAMSSASRAARTMSPKIGTAISRDNSGVTEVSKGKKGIASSISKDRKGGTVKNKKKK